RCRAAEDAAPLDAGAAEIGAELLEEVLPIPAFTPQPEEGVTYAEKIGPDDRVLDLSDPKAALARVRALSPHIGARTELHGRPVTVWRAHVENGEFVPDE